MPSVLPKRRVQPVYPALSVPVDEVFENPKYAATVDKVIRFLHPAYVNSSDGSYERTGRPGVITEQFFLPMPTVDAYKAEIALCNAIVAHASGEMKGESIKELLKKYLETHIYVYREIDRRWKQEIKTGHSPRTGREVPLFMFEWLPHRAGGNCVLNDIQVHLFTKLEALSGNNAKHRISRL